MNELKIASMLFTWNGVGDRFCKAYFEPTQAKNVFPQFAGSPIKGVELQYPNHVNENNLESLKDALKTHHLTPVIVNIPLAGEVQWSKGSFSSRSAEIREKAIQRVKEACDISRKIGANKVSMFLGQDGFDYPLTSNYRTVWENLLYCFDTCAGYAPDVQLCIEYKPREPRTHQYLSTAAKTMLLAEEIGKKNVGLLVDIGHAWMGGENMAEVIALAAYKERLFHVHFNDNFRLADDDLGVGGVHFVEYLEALFWLREVAYEGWLSLDVHSPRENSSEIIIASAEYLQNLSWLLERIGDDKVRTLVNSGDGSQLIRLLNAELFG